MKVYMDEIEKGEEVDPGFTIFGQIIEYIKQIIAMIQKWLGVDFQ